MVKLDIGWLSPEGKMYYCENSEGHWNLAYHFCQKYGYKDEVVYDEEDVLIRHGWVKIAKRFFDPDFHLYWNYGHLSSEAFEVMRDWFEDEEIKQKIIYLYHKRWDEEIENR